MSILGKVKELGAEIAKTVEESGIKDNVKCATIIIKDTVEKGKNDLEVRIGEGKRKVEEEKKRLASLGFNKEEEVSNNLQPELEVMDIEKAEKLANDFNEKLCCISSLSKELKLDFGNGCDEKNITKVLSNWNDVYENDNSLVVEAESDVVEDIETSDNKLSEYDLAKKEKFILCYNGGKKGLLLLSDKSFYLNLKHPIEELLYLVKIPTEKINAVSILKEDGKNIIAINNIGIGTVDVKIVSLLEKYFTKLEEKNYDILISDIIEEVKKVRFVESKVVMQIINDIISSQN